MALIMRMTEAAGKHLEPTRGGEDPLCANPHCITNQERYIPRSFRKNGDILVCDYCEERTLL